MDTNIPKIVSALSSPSDKTKLLIDKDKSSGQKKVVVGSRGSLGRAWDRLVGKNKLSDCFNLIATSINAQKSADYQDTKMSFELSHRVQVRSSEYYDKTYRIGRFLWGHGNVKKSAEAVNDAVYNKLYQSFVAEVKVPTTPSNKHQFVDNAYHLLTEEPDNLISPEDFATLDMNAQELFGKQLDVKEFWNKFAELGYPVAQLRIASEDPASHKETLQKLGDEGSGAAQILLIRALEQEDLAASPAKAQTMASEVENSSPLQPSSQSRWKSATPVNKNHSLPSVQSQNPVQVENAPNLDALAILDFDSLDLREHSPYGETHIQLLSLKFIKWINTPEQPLDQLLELQSTLEELQNAYENNLVVGSDWVTTGRKNALKNYSNTVNEWVAQRLEGQTIDNVIPVLSEEVTRNSIAVRTNIMERDLAILSTEPWENLIDKSTGFIKNDLTILSRDTINEINSALKIYGGADENWTKWLNDDGVDLLLAFLTERNSEIPKTTINGVETPIRFPIPVNHGSSHWTVAIADVEAGTIHYYDSMRNHAVPESLRTTAKELSIKFNKSFEVKDKSTRVQNDGYQCGVWSSFTAYKLCKDPKYQLRSIKKPAETIAHFRRNLHENVVFPLVIEYVKAGYDSRLNQRETPSLIDLARQRSWFGLDPNVIASA